MSPTHKILIIKRDKIGDLILTTPLFALIKSQLPTAELHLLANTYNGWVVENDSHIDKLWLYPRAKENGRSSLQAAFTQARQLMTLRHQRFDWIIVAGSYASKRANWRARWIATNKTRIAAYCDAATASGITDPLRPPNGGHEVERMADLLRPLGINVSALPPPHIEPPSSWISEANDFLAVRGLAANGYVMLGIGARRRARQPSAAQILRWSRAIHERHGLATVFTWTPGSRDDNGYPGDDDIAAEVLAQATEWLHPYRGTLGTVVGLTWLARTSLFPDSGLMHIAAASPGGVTGLFTASPEQWGPRGPRARVLIAGESVDRLADDVVLTALDLNLKNE
jgi:heptosyltransferase-3